MSNYQEKYNQEIEKYESILEELKKNKESLERLINSSPTNYFDRQKKLQIKGQISYYSKQITSYEQKIEKIRKRSDLNTTKNLRRIKNKVMLKTFTVAMIGVVAFSSIQSARNSYLNDLATRPNNNDSIKDEPVLNSVLNDSQDLRNDISRYSVLKSIGSLTDEEKNELIELENKLYESKNDIILLSDNILKAKIADGFKLKNIDSVEIEKGYDTRGSSEIIDLFGVDINGAKQTIKAPKFRMIAERIYNATYHDKKASKRSIIRSVLRAYNSTMKFAKKTKIIPGLTRKNFWDKEKTENAIYEEDINKEINIAGNIFIDPSDDNQR